MDNSYRKIKLKEVVKHLNTGLDAIRRAPIVIEDTGFKCLRIQDISQNKDISKWGNTKISPKDFEQHKIQAGDIIMARTCSTGIHYFARDDIHAVYNNGLARIRFKEDVLPEFAHYMFSTREFTGYIRGVSGGTSVQQNMQLSDILNYEISLPPLSSQHRIASILSSFDNKIELLRKENNTLEDIAQSIFKEWFIKYNFPNKDGKPYRDNKGKMIDSELGLIPEGWRVGKLGEMVSSFISGDYGKEIQDSIYNTESICIRGTDLKDVLSGNPDKAPRRFLKKKSITEKLLQPGDLIIEISGGTEGQSTGRVCYINQEFLNRFNLPMTCVNFCKIIRPQPGSTYALYSYLQYFYNKGLFFNCENGSTGIKNLSLKTVFDGIPVALPSLDLLTTFDIKISIIYKKIQKNNAKSSLLMNAKDNLLKSLIK